MILIFFGCKEKDPIVDPCSNGFIDAGETGVDCGGKCPPCSIYNPPSLYMELNGTPISMVSKSIDTSAGNFILLTGNDSLSFQFNLGNTLSIGTFPMNTNGTIGIRNSNYYLNASNGTLSLSAVDTAKHYLSGFLQVNLSRTGFSDTLKIKNCQFDYIPYP